jgi:hypothetical protein
MSSDVSICGLSMARLAQAATLVLMACNAMATEHWVDDNAASYSRSGSSCTAPGYSSIQAAVNAAAPGDTIKVCPGAYEENVSIGTPKLTVISTAGPYATVVKAAAVQPVFLIMANTVTVQGFGMRSTGTAKYDMGVFVHVDGIAAATVQGNVIQGGRFGVHVGCANSHSTIAGNIIAGQSVSGINLDTCESGAFPGTHDNLVRDNVACGAVPVASITLGGTVSNNQILNNVATTISVFGNANVVQGNTTQLPIANGGIGTVLGGNIADPGVCT